MTGPFDGIAQESIKIGGYATRHKPLGGFLGGFGEDHPASAILAEQVGMGLAHPRPKAARVALDLPVRAAFIDATIFGTAQTAGVGVGDAAIGEVNHESLRGKRGWANDHRINDQWIYPSTGSKNDPAEGFRSVEAIEGAEVHDLALVNECGPHGVPALESQVLAEAEGGLAQRGQLPKPRQKLPYALFGGESRGLR